VTFVDTANAFAVLMNEILSYERFAVHGSDMGAIVSALLGHKYADRIIALHTTAPGILDQFLGGERPWDIGGQPPAELPADIRRTIIDWQAGITAHVAVHTLDPQSLAYGTHDSPTALAAWILARGHDRR